MMWRRINIPSDWNFFLLLATIIDDRNCFWKMIIRNQKQFPISIKITNSQETFKSFKMFIRNQNSWELVCFCRSFISWKISLRSSHDCLPFKQKWILTRWSFAKNLYSFCYFVKLYETKSKSNKIVGNIWSQDPWSVTLKVPSTTFHADEINLIRNNEQSLNFTVDKVAW